MLVKTTPVLPAGSWLGLVPFSRARQGLNACPHTVPWPVSASAPENKVNPSASPRYISVA